MESCKEKQHKKPQITTMKITITIVIIIKKQLRDVGAGFNLKDHGINGSDFFLYSK